VASKVDISRCVGLSAHHRLTGFVEVTTNCATSSPVPPSQIYFRQQPSAPPPPPHRDRHGVVASRLIERARPSDLSLPLLARNLAEPIDLISLTPTLAVKSAPTFSRSSASHVSPRDCVARGSNGWTTRTRSTTRRRASSPPRRGSETLLEIDLVPRHRRTLPCPALTLWTT
jgi:hypothetical protein